MTRAERLCVLESRPRNKPMVREPSAVRRNPQSGPYRRILRALKTSLAALARWSQVAGVTQVLALCGSLRKGSYNAALLRAAVELSPAGLSITAFPLRELPLYDDDVRAA